MSVAESEQPEEIRQSVERTLIDKARADLAELRLLDNLAILDGGTRISPDLIESSEQYYHQLSGIGHLHAEQIGRSAMILSQENIDYRVNHSLVETLKGSIEGIENPVCRRATIKVMMELLEEQKGLIERPE